MPSDTTNTSSDNPWESEDHPTEMRPPIRSKAKAKLDSSYFGKNKRTTPLSRFRRKSTSSNNSSPESRAPLTSSRGTRDPSCVSFPGSATIQRGQWTPDTISPAPQRAYCLPCCEGPSSDPDDAYFYVVQGSPPPVNLSIGTTPSDGVWLNKSDKTGLVMSCLVWVLMTYATLVVIFLGKSEDIPEGFSTVFVALACLALACHAKTSLTDPGTVPIHAEPLQSVAQGMAPCCSRCKSYKPPFSHHCRICNRCVSRMDHHCPWMNNCVGSANLKFFILFLIYMWLANAYALVLLGYNYFVCATEDCTFNVVLLQFTRIMTVIAVVFFLFTSSMIMNVIYGVMTGIGTIDRMKKKSNKSMNLSDEEPIMLKEIFGVGPWWQWPLPIDPVFEDMGAVTKWRVKSMRE